MSISNEADHNHPKHHSAFTLHFWSSSSSWASRDLQCVHQMLLLVILSILTSAIPSVYSDNVYRRPPLNLNPRYDRGLEGTRAVEVGLGSPHLLGPSSSSSSSSAHHYGGGAIGGGSLISPQSVPQRAKCETTLHTCSRDMRCAMALQDYRTSCSHLLHNKTRTCSEVCRLALMSLNSLSEGYDYLNCDCGENEFCRKVRRRTSVCHSRFNSHSTSSSASSSSSSPSSSPSGSSPLAANIYGVNFPLDAVQPPVSSSSSSKGQASLGSPFSSPSASSGSHHRYKGKGAHHGSTMLCSTAETRCREDETCSEAWEFVQVHCEKVFIGTECTKSCNNSLNILWRQKAALYLATCICSDSMLSSSTRTATPFALAPPSYSSSSSSSLSSPSSLNSFNELSCKRRKANIKRLCFGYSSPSALSGTASRSTSLYHLSSSSSSINQLTIIVSVILLNTINLPVNWILLSILMSFYSINVVTT